LDLRRGGEEEVMVPLLLLPPCLDLRRGGGGTAAVFELGKEAVLLNWEEVVPLPPPLGLEEGGGGAAAVVFGLEKRGEVLLLPYSVDAVTVVISGLRLQNKGGEAIPAYRTSRLVSSSPLFSPIPSSLREHMLAIMKYNKN
jgi:hypothetical protein